jgi:hypothetical protein
MWMFAEIIDQSGNVLLRAENDIKDESDLTSLVAAVNERFRNEYPQRSLLDNVMTAMRQGLWLIRDVNL